MLNEYKPKFYVEPNKVMEDLKEHLLVDGYDFVLDLQNSQGSYFVDERNGKKFLDFFTCFASMPIGINHPKVTDPNFKKYLADIAVNKPSNSDVYTTVYATFVKTLFQTAVPDYFKYAFFISGGALAVENALKTAFDWKVKKNFAKGYKFEKGHKILHFKEAFHGRTGYTMSLTNTDPKKVQYFPKFDWPRVTNPKIIFPLSEHLDEVLKSEEQAIIEIKKAFIQNKDDIAAIIIESIQGEGGDNHFRKEFLQKLRLLADENDALLIFDEVQTGVGLTGKWWAHEHYDVQPDIMAFGKKMQICGILVGEKIDEVENNVFHESSRINSTWGGNLVDMARATRYLEIIDEDQLIDNAANQGKYLMEKLKELQNNFPNLVSNIRGLGLFAAFDLPDSKIKKSFVKNCFENELFILPSGHNSIRFRPPLTINKDEIDKGFEILNKVSAKY